MVRDDERDEDEREDASERDDETDAADPSDAPDKGGDEDAEDEAAKHGDDGVTDKDDDETPKDDDTPKDEKGGGDDGDANGDASKGTDKDDTDDRPVAAAPGAQVARRRAIGRRLRGAVHWHAWTQRGPSGKAGCAPSSCCSKSWCSHCGSRSRGFPRRSTAAATLASSSAPCLAPTCWAWRRSSPCARSQNASSAPSPSSRSWRACSWRSPGATSASSGPATC